MGRPEADLARKGAITELGNGLYAAGQREDALSVQEVELSMHRRLGSPMSTMFMTQGNLATTYQALRRFDEAMRMRRDIYSGTMKLYGEEHRETIREANNYAALLKNCHRHKEAKSLLRRTIPVGQRVLRENDQMLLTMKKVYAESLYRDSSATLDDLRKAVATLEDVKRTARRVLGGAHPLTVGLESTLRNARAVLRARDDEAA